MYEVHVGNHEKLGNIRATLDVQSVENFYENILCWAGNVHLRLLRQP